MSSIFQGDARPRSAGIVHQAAQRLQCEPRTFAAILRVEAAGRGFDAQGRLKMRFEPHVFYRLLPPEKRALAVSLGVAYPRMNIREVPADSYPRLVVALAVDEELAIKSASWGLGQLMGFHHSLAGYKTAREMIEAMREGEDAQILAMADFVASQPYLKKALQRKDWKRTARLYNGPANVATYAAKLSQAYLLEHPEGHQ